jgi:ABC-type phosphate transport system permease subunit
MAGLPDDWRRAIQYARDNERYQLTFVRGAVALLIPAVASFYSSSLALALAVPFCAAFVISVRRSINRENRR